MTNKPYYMCKTIKSIACMHAMHDCLRSFWNTIELKQQTFSNRWQRLELMMNDLNTPREIIVLPIRSSLVNEIERC